MTSLLILLLSHYIGDYALQTEYLASNKGKDNYILVAHVAVWTYIVSTTTLFLNMKIMFLLVILAIIVVWGNLTDFVWPLNYITE